MDGRHLLLGAPEAASEGSQRDRHHLRLLPLQPHHGEAADVAKCSAGTAGVGQRQLDIDLDSSLLTNLSPTSLSTTQEWRTLSLPTECPSLESSSEEWPPSSS